jgi:probable F420-dependent oxidoreductase
VTRQAQFGVRIPVAGVLSSPEAIRSSAIEAETVGFDTLWVHDYLIWNKTLDSVHISCGSREAFEAAGPDYPPMFYESLTSLAYCAAVTQRIRLGIAVLVLPYREPLFTAKQIACVDDLSGGRLDLGVGQGAAKSTLNVDFEVLGVSRATKVSQTREHLEAMKLIWAQDSPSYHGRFVNFDDATIYPKPRQQPHPPIWIGGSADKSLDMVADYADAWLSCWVTPDQFPVAISDLQARLAARGRPADALTIGSEIQVLLADSADEPWERLRPDMPAPPVVSPKISRARIRSARSGLRRWWARQNRSGTAFTSTWKPAVRISSSSSSTTTWKTCLSSGGSSRR